VIVTTGLDRFHMPPWLEGAFARGVVEAAERLGWGFRNETWKVTLTDGRRVAVTRLADPEAAPSTVRLMTEIQPCLLAADIPSPVVVDSTLAASGLIVTKFVDGTPGAEVLGQQGGPRIVGSILGAAWRRLSGIDVTGIHLPSTWAAPDDLVSDSSARLARTGGWLSAADRRHLSADIETLGGHLSSRRPGLVHGDLVPVNILARRGQLAALLDFEFIRLADPLLDAAWFDWIVAYHHPADEPAAWRAFVTSAGLDDREPLTRELLRIFPLVRLLEILDDESLRDEHVGGWIRMLRACLTRPR
jgi:aminoglycoside phosphotransferase (APT) family kinase protein